MMSVATRRMARTRRSTSGAGPLAVWLGTWSGLAVLLILHVHTAPPRLASSLDRAPERFTRLVLGQAPPPSTQAPPPRTVPGARPVPATPPVAPARPAPTASRPVPTQAQTRDQLRQSLLDQSVLIRMMVTRGEGRGFAEDMWSAEEQGLGDIDAALRAGSSGARSAGIDLRAGSGSRARSVDIGDLRGVVGGSSHIGTASRIRVGAVEVGTGDMDEDLVLHSAPTAAGPGLLTPVATAPRSTFSLDVDTASYTRVRGFLRRGHLPPWGAVRVEEFVNYLPCEYPRPAVGPFQVDVEAAPHPWRPGRHLIRLGVQARRVPSPERKPAHLTFLIDTSGSMDAPDRLDLVRDALSGLAGELDRGDTVAIVTFSGQARLVLEPTGSRAAIDKALVQLSADGSTDLGAGLELAYDQAAAHLVPGDVNRVILASDGIANRGTLHASGLLDLVADQAGLGVTLTVLGVGSGGYQDGRMERLADDGDGNYYFLDRPEEARRVLVDQLVSTVQVVARDAKVQVEWDPEAVEAYRLIGYDNRRLADHQFRDDAVDAAEIGSGHHVTALYEVELAQPVEARWGEVHLRVQPPGPEAPATEQLSLLGDWDLKPSLQECTADTRLALAAAWFAELLGGSTYARDLDPAQVERLAAGARRAEYREDAELVELIGRARALGLEERIGWERDLGLEERSGTPVPGPSGQVGVGPPGSMARAGDVRQVVQSKAGQLKYCYEQRLKVRPALSGRLEVEWTIDYGRVTRVSVFSNTTGDQQLTDCVMRKIRRWRFPSHVAGDVSWPFVFTPA